MLSLKERKNSIPIALYNNGRNRKVKYIHYTKNRDLDDDEEEDDEEPEVDYEAFDYNLLLKEPFFDKMSKRDKVYHMKRIQEMLINNKHPIKKAGLYEKSKKFIQKNQENEIIVKNLSVETVPSILKRDILYVSGPSGVGKSYFSRMYTIKYHKMFPKNRIFLFSKKNEDENFDELKYIERVEVDEELFDGLKVEDFRDSLTIFDDSHVFRDYIGKCLQNLQIDLMNLGRSYGINMIITSHLLTNYRKTKDILNELTGITIFPEATSYHELRYCLTNHFGLEKKDLRKILKLRSRWVYLNKFPRYIVHEHGVYIPI